MKRFSLTVAAACLALVACSDDPICPLGTYAMNGTCVPFGDGDTDDTGGGGSDVGADTGSTDTGGGEDTSGTDTGGEDTGSTDTGGTDTGGEDTGGTDTGGTDTGGTDTGGTDTGGTDTVCVPDCEGSECGPDGCGGSCGRCTGDEDCVEGSCENTNPVYTECDELAFCIVNCGGGFECEGFCRLADSPSRIQSAASDAADCAGSECGELTWAGRDWQTCVARSCDANSIACLGVEPPDTGDGACNNSADIGALVENADSLRATLGSCTIGCLSGGSPAPCISECTEEELGTSAACSDCFGGVGACTLDNCTFQCFSPESPECTACIGDFCLDDFATCAGIDVPGF